MNILSLKSGLYFGIFLGIVFYNFAGGMSIFRNIVWYVKGLREYTKSGYETASKNFNAADLEVDCSSKSYLITGGNSGLGYETALEIAKRNGTVHLVCRNEVSGSEAKRQIIQETKNSNVHLHIVDMANPKQIKHFTNSFESQHGKLHVLINNAGVLLHERKKTEDGLDVNFATNTLAYYLMTKGLLDVLKKSEEGRVIFVSSGGMLLQKLDYEDFNFEKMTKYDGTIAYSQNKRQEVIMIEQFAKAEPSVFFASMHPGWSDTPGVKSSLSDFHAKMKDKLRTVGQGADTIFWLSISPAATKFPSGSFFQDRVPVEKHLPLAWTRTTEAEDAQFMQKLSEMTF